MLAQTVLPFKLKATNGRLTAHAGLAVRGEFAHAIGLKRWVKQAFPAPGSAVGYAAWEYVQPLLLMLHGGGRALEETRQIRHDDGLRRLLGIEAVPSPDAYGDWLRRMSAGDGYAALAQVNRQLLHQALRSAGREDYPLAIDATQIVAEKQAARITYKGERGYMPMLGHLAENGWVVGEEFREGNASPGARNLEFIQHCAAQLPKGARIAQVRADSAAYQAKLFDGCAASMIGFAIGADLDAAVKTAIRALPERAWQAQRSALPHFGQSIVTSTLDYPSSLSHIYTTLAMPDFAPKWVICTRSADFVFPALSPHNFAATCAAYKPIIRPLPPLR